MKRPASGPESTLCRTEARDAFLDDRARSHRDLDHVRSARVVDRADVDALIARPVLRRSTRLIGARGNTQDDAGRPVWTLPVDVAVAVVEPAAAMP
jgi:hypothetical protein